MAMTTINGFPIYAVTRNDVEYRPSYFQQQAETWVEGSKRDSLTRQEIEELKRRYKCKNMSCLGSLWRQGLCQPAPQGIFFVGLLRWM